MEIKEIEFSKLRHAYLTVKAFIESETWNKGENINFKTKLAKDLGLLGDDNFEFLEKFVQKFELEHGNFDYSKHFWSEGELYDSYAVLLKLLTLSVYIPLKTIELITFNKLRIDKPKFISFPERNDLTFKELIIWFIEKDYKSTKRIKYEIKTEI